MRHLPADRIALPRNEVSENIAVMTPCPAITPVSWHPSVGVFIGILGFLGVIVPLVRPKMRRPEKAVWIFVLTVCLLLELRSIKLDQVQHDREQDFARCQQIRSFQSIANTLNKSMDASRDQFSKTMGQFSETNKQEQQRFNALVTQDKRLFDHEEKLAESTSGTLVPGSLPFANDCTRRADSRGERGFAVIYGDNTSVINAFPHYIIKYKGKPLITLRKLADNSIVVIMDVRDKDGKIVARLDDSGYLIGDRLSIERPNISTLIVIDEYGEEALYIHYLNPSAIQISGHVNFGDEILPIQNPHIHQACDFGSPAGGTSIAYN